MFIDIPREKAELLLQQSVNKANVSFKDGQWEAIDALVNKRRKVLVVQKTGWGKSVVYFLSSYLLKEQSGGITIVISPLLSLIRNQILAASRLNLSCCSMNSENQDNWERIKQEILLGKIDVLFISPERLANQNFISSILRPISQKINLLVVDEVHCISDWGHDFRPDYKRISNILRFLPENTPLVGTTATANSRVVEDIKRQFGENIIIQRGELTRGSIHLDTFELPDKASRLAFLVEFINKIDGSGIVYTNVVRDTYVVSEWLKRNGINAEAYSSELQSQNKILLEEKLLKNEIKVLVATVALGMGFDKPDVSFVIHYQTPGGVIGYYQQVGRAGRGIEKSFGVLLSGKEDANIQEYFRNQAFPTEEELTGIIGLLDKARYTKNELLTKLNYKAQRLDKALSYLSTLPYPPVIKDGKYWIRTVYPFTYDRELISWFTVQKEKEWNEICEYIKTKRCKMQFLAEALNSKVSPCGHCSSCLGRHLFENVIRDSLVEEARKYLIHSYICFNPRKRFTRGNLFHAYSFLNGINIPSDLYPEIGYILSQWGEAPYGDLVCEQKHNGAFEQDLVNAFVTLVREKGIDKKVSWVTCIPSKKHPHLVEDFSRAVAQQLNLPFDPVISKTKENEPQKMQNNSESQCRNLDGVFDLTHLPTKNPVLLIDDVYDSGWTFTIASALLRLCGVPAVFPAALAKTTSK